jgi:hypothetical protein
MTAMVLVALALRLIAVALLYQAQLDPVRNYMVFGWETGSTARAIAAGEGFSSPLPEGGGPSALLPPIYTYLLAGTFRLFGTFSKESALAILGLNSVFSALTCLPIYLAARQSFGGRVACWSGWVWALFPYAVFFSAARVWNTTLAALLLSVVFITTLRLGKDSGWFTWVELWIAMGLQCPGESCGPRRCTLPRGLADIPPAQAGGDVESLNRHQCGGVFPRNLPLVFTELHCIPPGHPTARRLLAGAACGQCRRHFGPSSPIPRTPLMTPANYGSSSLWAN